MVSKLKDSFRKIFFNSLRIRLVEERIAEKYSEQKMRCPTHLSIGQELPPSIVSNCLEHEDYAVSSHRAHAHYLAKGGSLKAVPEGNKGLKKLPTAVRNKMGYMQKGGSCRGMGKATRGGSYGRMG